MLALAGRVRARSPRSPASGIRLLERQPGPPQRRPQRREGAGPHAVQLTNLALRPLRQLAERRDAFAFERSPGRRGDLRQKVAGVLSFLRRHSTFALTFTFRVLSRKEADFGASERASERRERSAPAERRARERVGESEGRSPSENQLIIEDEGHHHVHLVLGDTAVGLTADLMLFDPGAPDVSKRLGGPGEAQLDGVLEALRRGRADLGHLGYWHRVLLLRRRALRP